MSSEEDRPGGWHPQLYEAFKPKPEQSDLRNTRFHETFKRSKAVRPDGTERPKTPVEDPAKHYDVVFLVERRIFGKPQNVAQAAQDLEVKIRALWSIPELKEGEVRIVEALQDHTINSVLEAVNITNDRRSFLVDEIERQAREMPLKQMPVRPPTYTDGEGNPISGEIRIQPGAARLINEMQDIRYPEPPPSRQGYDHRVLVREPTRKELQQMNEAGELPGCRCCEVGRNSEGYLVLFHHHEKCQHQFCEAREGVIAGINISGMNEDDLKGIGDTLSCGCCVYERDPDGNSLRIHDHDKCRHQLCPDREGVAADIDVAGMDDATFLAATNPDETSWIHRRFQEDEAREVTPEQFKKAKEMQPRLDGPSTDRTDPRCPDHGRRGPCPECDPYVYSQKNEKLPIVDDPLHDLRDQR